jgi:menaquinone-dependent protoporphyrinogen IX oxidase
MKTIVLYESKYGSTEQYAKDIAKAVNAECMPLKKFRFKNIEDYDTIVFGGWVRGGVIRGIDQFLSHYDEMENKNVIVFAVGMAMSNPDTRALLISSNLLDMYHIRFYQMQGKFDYSKLNPIEKMMIKASITRMENDPNLGDFEKANLSRIMDTPITGYDEASVQKVIRVLNKISLETPQA